MKVTVQACVVLVCALLAAAPAGAVQYFFDDFNDNDMTDWTDTEKTVQPYNNTRYGLYGSASRGESYWDKADTDPTYAISREAVATKPFSNTSYDDTLCLSFDVMMASGYKGDTLHLGIKHTYVYMVDSATGVGYGIYFAYKKRATDGGALGIVMTTDYGVTASWVKVGAQISLPEGTFAVNDFSEHTVGLEYNRVLGTFDMYLDGSWTHGGVLDPGQNAPCANPDMIISAPRNLFNTYPPITDVDWSGWIHTDDIWVGDGFNAPAEIMLAPGDTDGNLKVDIVDLTALAANWPIIPPLPGPPGAKDWNQGDFNFDWIVDIVDLTALAANWTFGPGDAPPAVPEPATMALLALGGLGLLRRRR